MLWVDLAWRNIRANARRSALIGGTVLVSVVALVLFAGYLNATRLGMEYSTIRGGVGHFQVSGDGGFDRYAEVPLQYGLTPALREQVEGAADQMPHVRRIVPRLSFSGLVSNGPQTLSASVSGIDPIAENAAFGNRYRMVAGNGLSASDPENAAVIGEELARRLGVEVGGYVTLLAATVNGSINAVDLDIAGIATTGNPQSDLYLLQMQMEPAQQLIATDRLSGIAILLDEGADAGTAASALHRAAPGTEVRTWRQLSPMYDQVVGMYEALFAVFGVFILAVTGFAIATAILTGVMERTREIGVLRSLGISAKRVRSAFLIEALMLSGIGVASGIAAGLVLGRVLNALNLTAPPPPGRSVGYPFRIIWDGEAAVLICIAVLVLTAAASWVASTRIAKLRVVTALGAH